MSFYITLPSNSSTEFYPSNTLQNFTTKLSSNIKLHGKYKVALVEVFFPTDYKVDYGEIHLSDKKTKNISKTQIFLKDNENIEQVLEELNKNLFNVFSNRVKFVLQSNQHVSIILQQHHQLSISTRLKNLFKFEDEIIDESSTGKGVVEKIISSIPSLYLYCDIIKPQFVGDAFVQVLQIIKSSGNSSGSQQHIIYSNPHYVRVNTQEISNINTSFFSDTGEKILFSNKKLFIKLHFIPD